MRHRDGTWEDLVFAPCFEQLNLLIGSPSIRSAPHDWRARSHMARDAGFAHGTNQNADSHNPPPARWRETGSGRSRARRRVPRRRVPFGQLYQPGPARADESELRHGEHAVDDHENEQVPYG